MPEKPSSSTSEIPSVDTAVESAAGDDDGELQPVPVDEKSHHRWLRQRHRHHVSDITDS